MMPADPDRRETMFRLLRLGGGAGAAAGVATWLSSRTRRPEEPAVADVRTHFTVPPDPGLPDMVIARGDGPRPAVRRAIEELGGMRRFVTRGDVVVVKPNVGWDRIPEQGANTNPEVVAELVRLCREAGAKTVIVADVSINEPRRCFARSGIAEAARAEGAGVDLPDERRFREVNLRGQVLGIWPVFDPFLAADKMINVPVAKHHNLTGVSLGMKNWYGILGGQRHRLHQQIHESLADLADFMRPTLTVVDAWRVLVRGGPGGGNPEDAVLTKTIVAGTDPVAVDAWTARQFWKLDARTLRYLALAARRGLGRIDYETLRTRTVSV